MRDLALLVLGWFFGLLSGPITEWLARRRLARSLCEPLMAELRDLQDRSAGYAFHVKIKQGTFKRADLVWTMTTLVAAGLERSDQIVHKLRKLLESGVDDRLLGEMYPPGEDIAVSTRTIELPFLSAQLHQIDLFTPATQQLLLQILMDVRLYREIVEEARGCQVLTYDRSLTAENHARIFGNAAVATNRLGEHATKVADEAGNAISALTAEKQRRWW